MAFNPKHLISRCPILDRNGEIAFFRLDMAEASQDIALPFMLRLTNIDAPQMVYFMPLEWVADNVLLIKLARDMVLTTEADTFDLDIAQQAKQRGFRLAVQLQPTDALTSSNFTLIPFQERNLPRSIKRKSANTSKILELQLPELDDTVPQPDTEPDAETVTSLPPNTVLTGIDTIADFEQAKDSGATYFSGHFFMDCPLDNATKPNIHPGHAVILELMAAVQKEVDPKALEAIAKRDVTLSFKLLRYVNSPFFGLTARVESVRHAVSILGYQQLLKWLSLLAVTAGSGASPALTHAAMTRAKLMELLGKNMDKKDQDNLFVTGMFSLLDRIMRVPLEEVLKRVNLTDNVTSAVLAGEGRYRRFLDLAMACEGAALPEDGKFSDIDIKAANVAHFEAIEWATKILRLGSPEPRKTPRSKKKI